MPNANKKAVIYCRVSTKEQVDEGGSLATQEKNCREYALKSGYDIASVFIEQGESAKTKDRTELTKLLTYCSSRKNGISAVIAYKVDRIARNIDDYRQIRLLLKKHGIEIKSTSEYFEDTPAGRFMENIIANVAQFDNDVRTERCVGGMKEAIREGRFVWGAPLGYSNIKIGGKSNIAPNDMASLVVQAFNEVAKNIQSVNEIHRQMVRAGLANKKGKPVSKGYFYSMLTNELYVGHINGLGEHVKGVFEPLISQELFDQVQRVLKRRTHRTVMYKRDNEAFPLRRFIFHPTGKKLTGCWCKGRNNKYPYYLFHLKGMMFRKEYLETAFKLFLNQFKMSEEQYSKLEKYVRQNLIQSIEGQRKQNVQSENYVVELKERQKALIQKNISGIISDALLKEQLDLIEEEITRISSSIISYSGFEKRHIAGALDLVVKYLKNPGAVWEMLPLQSKLRLQWFNFPKGVSFDGKKFQTAEICRLLTTKEGFEPSLSSWVNPRKSKLNRNLPKYVGAQQFIQQMVELSEILSD